MSMNFVDYLFEKEINMQMQYEVERRRFSRNASKNFRKSKVNLRLICFRNCWN